MDRISYVCDSFAGLPPGDRSLDRRDKNWDNEPYLEVASEIVASSFNRYGLLDHNVVFAKGFFNETAPVLSKHVDKLAIMRLDVSIRDQERLLLRTCANVFACACITTSF